MSNRPSPWDHGQPPPSHDPRASARPPPAPDEAPPKDERKRVEEAAKASEERLCVAFEAAKIGTGEWNLLTDKISLSDSLLHLFGDAPGAWFPSFDEYTTRIHPDDQAHVRRLVFYDGSGRAARIVAAVMDITAMKLLEQRLEERLHFEALLSELSAAFANVPASAIEEQIKRWLERLAAFLGADHGSLYQFTRLFEYIAEEDRPRFREHVFPAVMQRGRWEGEMGFRHWGGGAPILMLQHTFLVRDDQSQHPLALAAIAFLPKPFTAHALARKVRDVLDAP